MLRRGFGFFPILLFLAGILVVGGIWSGRAIWGNITSGNVLGAQTFQGKLVKSNSSCKKGNIKCFRLVYKDGGQKIVFLTPDNKKVTKNTLNKLASQQVEVLGDKKDNYLIVSKATAIPTPTPTSTVPLQFGLGSWADLNHDAFRSLGEGMRHANTSYLWNGEWGSPDSYLNDCAAKQMKCALFFGGIPQAANQNATQRKGGYSGALPMDLNFAGIEDPEIVDPIRDSFSAAVFDAVRKYGRKIDLFSFQNEPDLAVNKGLGGATIEGEYNSGPRLIASDPVSGDWNGNGKEDFKDYAYALKIFYDAVTDANAYCNTTSECGVPAGQWVNVKVGTGAFAAIFPSNPKLPNGLSTLWVEKMIAYMRQTWTSDPFDVVNLHHYGDERQTWGGTQAKLNWFQTNINKGKNFAMSEVGVKLYEVCDAAGYGTYPTFNATPACSLAQSRETVKFLARLAAFGKMQFIDWYILGTSGEGDQAHQTALLKLDSTKRPVYFTYKYLTKALFGYLPSGKIAITNVEGYSFTKLNSPIKEIVWSASSTGATKAFPVKNLTLATPSIINADQTLREIVITDGVLDSSGWGDSDGKKNGFITLKLNSSDPLIVSY